MNMKLLKKIFLLIALPLAVAVSVTSCNEDDNSVSLNTVDTLLSTTPNVSIFKAALAKTGLNSFSRGGGPFTYFVPSDDAFKASGINSAADLNAIDNSLLTQVLAYHIMAGNRTLVEIPTGPNAPATAVTGLSFYASKNTTGAFINGAKIIQADVRGSNGIIHVINQVMTPPFTNMMGSLQANTNFKLLVQGINKAGLSGTFTGTAANTLFAPTNAAMTAAGYDSTTIANLTGTPLTTFTNQLKYHLVAGRNFSSELKDGTMKTTLVISNVAQLITISNGGTKVKGATNAAPANITLANFLASNGVIHTVDGFLKY